MLMSSRGTCTGKETERHEKHENEAATAVEAAKNANQRKWPKTADRQCSAFLLFSPIRPLLLLAHFASVSEHFVVWWWRAACK